MTVNKDYIVALFPEFANEGEDRINALLPVISMQVNANVFGVKTDYATALLLCHTLKISPTVGGASGSGGPVTQERIGDLSRSYGQVDSSAGYGAYGNSPYGILFAQLRAQCVRGPMVT
jgi:hypothetical protein